MSVTSTPDSQTLQVIKRDGKRVAYDSSRIRVAISKAFTAVIEDNDTKKNQSLLAERLQRAFKKSEQLTQDITNDFKRIFPNGGTIQIESIQDAVEFKLMATQEEEDKLVAKRYVIYREEHRKLREAAHSQANQNTLSNIRIKLLDGTESILESSTIEKNIIAYCKDLRGVDPQLVLQQIWQNLYEGMSMTEVNQALVMGTSYLAERDPDYSILTARFLLNTLYTEATNFLGCEKI